MANIKSQITRNKTNEKNRIKNAALKTRFKTELKSVDKAIKENNKELALNHYSLASQALDKAAKAGAIHKNKADRKKSDYKLKINQLG